MIQKNMEIVMEKIIMIIEKSNDHFGAYSENCEGIYAAGDSMQNPVKIK